MSHRWRPKPIFVVVDSKSNKRLRDKISKDDVTYGYDVAFIPPAIPEEITGAHKPSEGTVFTMSRVPGAKSPKPRTA